MLYLRSTPRKPATQRRSARSRGDRGAAPGLRFLGEPRALVRSRPLVIAGSLLARLGAIDAVATWPDPAAPTVALDLRDATSDGWMGPMLPRRAHALRLNSRAWQIARARGLVIPRGRSVLLAAAERALGRAVNQPALSLYSPSACTGKLTCFVSEAGRPAPSAVLKVMAERRHGWWLQREVGLVGAVAEQLGPGARAALLEVPLVAEEIDGDYVVVEDYCELERWCEQSPAACARAHAWLRELHESTTRSRAAWSQVDTAAGVNAVLEAWRLVRPRAATRVARLTERRLQRLYRAPLARCATHGDFSPCNLAEHNGQLKVLDWEWSRLDSSPCFDLWSYQLAELHWQHLATSEQLAVRLDAALAFVEQELASVGEDPSFALALLPVVLAEHVTRVRRTFGHAGLWEASGDPQMEAVERLLERRAGSPAPRRAQQPHAGGERRPRPTPARRSVALRRRTR